MLFLDLETYCDLDLRVVALDRYSSHPSADILMCAYAVDDGPMKIWQKGEDRTELDRLITTSTCIAWNVSFERAMLARVWGIRAKAWQDAMVMARYASLPAGLKDCNKVPFFASESVTTKETQLINKFCKPSKTRVIHNAETDPEDWALFCDYCKRDVMDTRLIYKWLLAHFDMPERVYKMWLLDQEINKRGMPVDLPFFYNAGVEAGRLNLLAMDQLKEVTGLENPNSPAQLLKWVSERGYPYNSLGKELVTKAVAEMPDGEAKTALSLRLAAAKSSLKKIPKILQTTGTGGRLRDQYRFYGAHTGRWAGRGAQLQNLKAARTKEDKALVKVVVSMLEQGLEVASLDALSLGLRPGIKAPKGKKVVLADFKSVENRVLAWISGCDAMMEVYKNGKDPYIDFAARMEGCDYSEVTAEMRQTAKPGTLGCGFGLGGGMEVRWGKCSVFGTCGHTQQVALETAEGLYDCPKCHARTFKVGPKVKTGLWRYAEMMGVELSQADAAKQVNEFRLAFNDVCGFWIALEDCFSACTLTRREQSVRSSLGPVLYLRYKDPALRIVLPSGRELVYSDPFVQTGYTAKGFKTKTLCFDGVHGNSWGHCSTYGGRLCENVVQAIAVDLLADALLRVEADKRYEIVGHTHDEIITLADEKDAGALDNLVVLMSATESWAAGLPMAADGYEGPRYGK
jgi:DNA polymerase